MKFPKINKTYYALVLPAGVLMLFVGGYPTINAFILSFYNWQLQFKEIQFVGISNYIAVWSEPRFIESLVRTIKMSVLCAATEFVAGFGLALLFSKEFRGRRILTTIVTMPVMFTPVIVGFTWRMLFNSNYGPVNDIIDLIVPGTYPQPFWWNDETLAFFAIFLADFWQNMPFVFLVMLAGVSALPKEPFEAAVIDGASDWKIFRYLTVPLLKPLIYFMLLLRSLDVLKLFDYIMVTTGGGPGGTGTEVFSVYLSKVTFVYYQISVAITMSIIVLAFCSIATLLVFRVLSTAQQA